MMFSLCSGHIINLVWYENGSALIIYGDGGGYENGKFWFDSDPDGGAPATAGGGAIEVEGMSLADLKALNLRFHLIGDGRDNSFHGAWGEDWLEGGAGDDTLKGMGRTDFLFGDGGNDRLYGNTGNDFLYGGDGDDTLYGMAVRATTSWKVARATTISTGALEQTGSCSIVNPQPTPSMISRTVRIFSSSGAARGSLTSTLSNAATTP